MSKELVNKALKIKDARKDALKAKNLELAESLLIEYQDILKELPEDVIFAVSVY